MAGLASGHWVLQSPPSLGFNDATEGQAPCGGSDPTSRDKVTEWPSGGVPVSILSTHPTASWNFRAFPVGNVDQAVDMQPNVSQTGLGNLCFSAVPAPSSMVGMDAVVQIIQTAPDGALFQASHITKVLISPESALFKDVALP